MSGVVVVGLGSYQLQKPRLGKRLSVVLDSAARGALERHLGADDLRLVGFAAEVSESCLTLLRRERHGYHFSYSGVRTTIAIPSHQWPSSLDIPLFRQTEVLMDFPEPGVVRVMMPEKGDCRAPLPRSVPPRFVEPVAATPTTLPSILCCISGVDCDLPVGEALQLAAKYGRR